MKYVRTQINSEDIILIDYKHIIGTLMVTYGNYTHEIVDWILFNVNKTNNRILNKLIILFYG